MIRPLAGLAAATAISGLGTGMTMLAIPWFVLATTGDTLHTGVVTAAETLGLLAGSAVASGWVDRWGPRRCAVRFDLAAALVVAAIPLLHHLHLLTAGVLTVLAAVLGLSRAPGSTARQVLVPDIAARTGVAVERVSTIQDAPEQGAQALGAPVAGVVIALLGAPVALWIDAASFLLAASITRACQAESGHLPPDVRGLTALREGWRFLRGDRTLLAIMSTAAVTNALNAGLFSVLVPAYGAWVLASPVQLGAVFAATGAALVAGSALFSLVGLRWPRRFTVVVCCAPVLGPRAGIFLLQPPVSVLVVVSGVLMLAFGPLNPIFDAVKAERTPPPLRARVYATIAMAGLVGMPVGTVAAGVLSSALGLMPAIAVFTAIAALMSLCPLVFPAWRALDHPPAGLTR
ncbi:MFS transporter [Saccharopolyspora flava]|uniref:Multidrug efflux pump Tap n=1 Tax=Saccharopolyspora flava TaxID=95161 RepID=A0A1I6SX48_9PSEU|nr:MFS transporter [Saccharopolyspora flava]SFS81467.1 Major Facilitator Superfamily protein [Saccharopolyspora flava]